jgi:hypothetical protein
VDRTADPADHTPLGNDRGSLAADRGWLAGREAFAGDRGPVAGGRGSLAGDAGREGGERSRNVQADPFSSAWLRDGGVASRQEEAASPRLEPAHLRGGELGVGDLSQGIGAATAAQPWDTLAPAEPARAAATMVPEPRGRHRDRVVPVRLVVVIVLAALIGSMLMLLLL